MKESRGPDIVSAIEEAAGTERSLNQQKVIRSIMPSADMPTQLEKDLSYIISFFLPPFGIILAVVYYLKYPPELRTMARNCLIISIASMAVITLVVALWDALFG